MNKIFIFQIKLNESNHIYCYSGLDFLERHKLTIDLDRYSMVYTREMPGEIKNVYVLLEGLFEEFNLRHPHDFHGHSLSVSDIVKVNNDYYYCDSFGWKKITNKI